MAGNARESLVDADPNLQIRNLDTGEVVGFDHGAGGWQHDDLTIAERDQMRHSELSERVRQEEKAGRQPSETLLAEQRDAALRMAASHAPSLSLTERDLQRDREAYARAQQQRRLDLTSPRTLRAFRVFWAKPTPRISCDGVRLCEYLWKYLQGPDMVAGNRALLLPVPEVQGPMRLVMVRQSECLVCGGFDDDCRSYYISFPPCHDGWIACPDCAANVRLSMTRQLWIQKDIPMPREYDWSTTWSGPSVQFWRRSQRRVQDAKLTSRNGYFVHYSRTLRCFTMFASFKDARGEELERNVSLANLVCYNPHVFGVSPDSFPWAWRTPQMEHQTVAFWRSALQAAYDDGLQWHHALVPLVVAARRALGAHAERELPSDVIRHVQSFLCEYKI